MPDRLTSFFSSLSGEPEPILYPENTFRREYSDETPFQFTVRYFLSGILHVKDMDLFRQETQRYNTPETVLNGIVDAFHDQVVRPVFDELGLFFHYDFDKFGQTRLRLWQYRVEEDTGQVKVELAFIPNIREVIHRRGQTFSLQGCTVSCHQIKGIKSIPSIHEENVRMLRPEALALIRQNELFLYHMETVCIAVLAERDKLIHEAKTYGTATMGTVTVKWEGERLHIAWKNAQTAEGWRMLGFRRTGGFATEEFNEDANGARILDSQEASGSLMDANFPVNEPVYYTFLLRHQTIKQSGNTNTYHSVARFSETLPDQNSPDRLQRQLEELRLHAKIAEAKRAAAEANQRPKTLDEARFSSAQEQIRMAQDSLDLLKRVDQIEQEALQQGDGAREDRWRNQVTEICARLRETVRDLV